MSLPGVEGNPTTVAGVEPDMTAPTEPVVDAAAENDADGGTPADSTVREQLEAAIEAIRPALQADGGDIQLLGLDEETGRVDVELIGACGSCPASTMTLKAGIERILRDRVDGVREVNAVGVEPTFDAGPDYFDYE